MAWRPRTAKGRGPQGVRVSTHSENAYHSGSSGFGAKRMSESYLIVDPLRDTRPGAEVSGIDAATATRAEAHALKVALAEYGVVVLRDQDLTPKQYIAFAKLFGELEPSTREQYWHPEEPEIYLISNIVENGRPIGNPNDGFGWHTDQYYFERPTAYTFLYALEVPPKGADTQFCDTMEMYDELSDEQREAFDRIKIKASHSALNAGRLHPGQEEEYPDVVHDLIRRHPLSDRKFLYFSGTVTSQPHEMPEDEFRALLKGLHDRATQADRIYSHKWQEKDLVIWDNRGLMHRATAYDKERYRRLCYRLSVIGERPFK
jgi:taurine dioxygenase